jgi:hypothetical protein
MVSLFARWPFLFVLFSALPLVGLGQEDCGRLRELRTAFMDHSTLEQAEETERLAMVFLESASGDCALLIEAHRWVSLARSADFGFNPATKLQRLNAGLKGLDALIMRRPDLKVIQALRLSITGTAPRFLGVDDHWAADLAALQQLLQAKHWKDNAPYTAWMRDLAKQIQQERA